MKLSAAIKRAVALTRLAEAGPRATQVLLRPKTPEAPASVCVSDSGCQVTLWLDDGETVCHAALGLGELKGPALTASALVCQGYTPSRNSVSLKVVGRGGSVGELEVEAGPPSLYDAILDVPRDAVFAPVPPGCRPEAACHALDRANPDAPAWRYVGLCPYGVVTSDGERMASYALPFDWEGLVSRRLFALWPKGRADDVVALAATAAGVWCQLGPDERRFAPYAQAPSHVPKILERLAPGSLWEGARCQTDVRALVDAVTQATGQLRPGVVRLAKRGLRLRVEGASDTGERGYVGELEAHGCAGPDADVYVLGAFLKDALKAAKTPQVRLGFGSGTCPLRLEAGRLTASVWPYV